VIYTPQLMLSGKDYRRGMFGDDLAKQLVQLATPATAKIRVSASTGSESAAVNITTESGPGDAQIWLAIFENGLATEVRAGENRGKRLEHDFVVRDLAGPLRVGTATHTIALDRGWNRAKLGIAAFVSDARTGETLQA